MPARPKAQVISPARERVVLCTDRTIYISGEKISFAAMVYDPDHPQHEPPGKILYCELVTLSGMSVARAKFPVNSAMSHGCLLIPEEALTGIYYLKSYTRPMRNESVENYHFIRLKIIHPLRAEMLLSNGNGDISDNTASESDQAGRIGGVDITADKPAYSPGEEIKLNITNIGGKALQTTYCLAMVPEGSVDGAPLPVSKGENLPVSSPYHPEIRGISLTGRVVADTSGQVLPGMKINLSIIGEKDHRANLTDSVGRFYFALPDLIGNQDIFLSAGDIPGVPAKILIDNDFCTRPVSLAAPAFFLSEEEQRVALALAVNHKITSIYYPDTAMGETPAQPDLAPFYGMPSQVLLLDDYIELPTLEEYFNELPIAVKVRKSQGRKLFRFLSTQVDMTVYDPLLLIDWVAVDDVEKILAVSPRDIDRIELVNSPYIKGSITYGGIISIISKNNDFAGIDLPTSGTFLNYRFLSSCRKSRDTAGISGNLPDARNTIFWEPHLQADNEGNALISLIAPGTPGSYKVLLRSMDVMGELIYVEKIIEILGF